MAVVTAVTVATLAVGCSGDDDAVPTTTSFATTTEPPATTTTVEATTTEPTTTGPTTVPTTEPVPTTVPESTPSSTPDPTTTSPPDGVPPRVTFPDDPDKQAVVDAVYAYFDALNDAQADPRNSELREQVEATTGKPIQERVVTYLDGLVDDGQAFIDLGAERSHVDIFGDVMTIVDRSALVDACVVDRTSQVEVGGNPDGSDRILNDQVVAALLSYSLTESDTGWRVVELSVIDRFEDSDRCAD